MSRLTNILTASLLAIALVACGGSEGDTAEQAENVPEDAPIVATEPAPEEQAAEVPAPAGDYPQATVEGTMALFLDSLGKGDYTGATDLCDQTSIEVQESFAQRAENFTYPHPNPNVSETEIDFLRNLFSRPFVGAQWTVMSEDTESGQGSASVTLADGRTSEITLVYQDEAWFVFPYEGFLDWGEQSIGGIMEEQGDSIPSPAPDDEAGG